MKVKISALVQVCNATFYYCLSLNILEYKVATLTVHCDNATFLRLKNPFMYLHCDNATYKTQNLFMYYSSMASSHPWRSSPLQFNWTSLILTCEWKLWCNCYCFSMIRWAFHNCFITHVFWTRLHCDDATYMTQNPFMYVLTTSGHDLFPLMDTS